MINTGRNSFDSRPLEAFDHFVGGNTRRKVDIADGKSKEIVADRTSDIAGQSLLGAKRRKEPLHSAFVAPLGRIEGQCHWSLRDKLTIMAAVAPQILRSFQMIS